MFDSSLDVNRIVRKEWEKVSCKSSSIGEVMKKLSKEQPASFMARPVVLESDVDPFDGADISKEIVKGRVKKHSVETRRQLILVKNDNERVRVRCKGTIPTLVPYVAIHTNMDKKVFSQTKGGSTIRENINSSKQNILGKDKIVEGKSKKVITPKKVDKYLCPWTMLVKYTKEYRWEDLGIEANFNYTFISDGKRHIHENIKSQFKGGMYKEMLWNAVKATFEGEFKRKMGELKSFKSNAYDWLMKISLEQWSRACFSSRAKYDLLINNICEVFNRQLVNGRDQLIITCLEYIKEYLMKRIVVVQKVIAKTVGPLTPYVTKMFNFIKKANEYNV
nr:transposase, mutator type [Tanacetum cinerariifolium]